MPFGRDESEIRLGKGSVVVSSSCHKKMPQTGRLKPQKCISLSLEVGNPRSRYCLMQCLVRVVFLPCRWLSYCVSKSSHGEERDFFLVLHVYSPFGLWPHSMTLPHHLPKIVSLLLLLSRFSGVRLCATP